MSDESVEIEDMASGTRFRDSNEYVDIEGLRIKHETDLAVLVETEDGEEVWIPFSQISAIHRGEGLVVMTRWIARQKGLL